MEYGTEPKLHTMAHCKECGRPIWYNSYTFLWNHCEHVTFKEGEKEEMVKELMENEGL